MNKFTSSCKNEDKGQNLILWSFEDDQKIMSFLDIECGIR